MTGKHRKRKGIGCIPQEQLQKLSSYVADKDKKKKNANRTIYPGMGEHKPLIVPDLDLDVPFTTREGGDLRPSKACARLAGLAATAAFNKSSCFALVWPGREGRLPLVHALATLSLYAAFNGRELRTLVWPARSNATGFMRSTCIQPQWLHQKAGEIVSKKCQSRESCYGTMAFRPKNRILLKIDHFLRASGRAFPLVECMHAFYWRDNRWARKPASAFENLVRSVRGLSEKEETRQWAHSLSMPETAMDSLFCLHPDLGLADIKKRLECPEFDPDVGGTSPNLAILDLRAENWFCLEKKWAKTILLFDRFQNRGPIGPAGVLTITDSPLIMEKLHSTFTRWHFHPKTASCMHRPRFTAVPAAIAPDVFERCDLACENPPSSTDPRRFSVQVLGRATADIVVRFLDLASKIATVSRAGCECLRKAARDLSDASMLPGGFSALDSWLTGRSGGGDTPRSVWKHRLLKLSALLEEGELGDDYSRAEALIAQADAHAGSLAESTPAGKSLEEILDLVTSGHEAWDCQELVVVADTKPALFLCQELITEILGPGSGITTAHSRDIPKMDVDPGTAVVFLVSRQDCLQRVFMFKTPPAWCRIILGHSRAAAAVDLLQKIQGFRELQCFHPLASRLTGQIGKSAVSLSPQTSTRLKDMCHAGNGMTFPGQDGDAPKNQVSVWFDDHPWQHFFPRSTVYVLDPDSSWGYRAKTAMEISEGDTLLLMPKKVVDAIGWHLQRVEEDLAADAKRHVMAYKAMVRKTVAEESQTSAAEIARRLNREYNPEHQIQPPTLRRWFRAGEESKPGHVVPYAPESWEHFKIFSAYLGFTEDYARELHFHVRILRSENRQEGKWQKREVLSLLADRMDHLGKDVFPLAMIDDVRQQAETHSFRVSRVFKPDVS